MDKLAPWSGANAAAGPRSYVAALLMVAAATLLGLMIEPRWGNSAVDLIYLPAVLAAAVLGGVRPSIVAVLTSVLAYNFFFTAPYRTLRIDRPADLLTVVVLLIVALVTSYLTAAVRGQAQIAAVHAARNATIAGLARRLLSCTTDQEIAQASVDELADLFECNAVVVAGPTAPYLLAAQPDGVRLTPSDLGTAGLVLATGVAHGRGIDRVSTVEWQLHPVSSDARVLAVLGLARDDGLPAVSAERRELLQSLLDQIALALERARLERAARDFDALRERDRIRTTLLATIGADLEPPLAAIGSAVNQLRRKGDGDKAIVSEIGAQANRLQRFLANLVELGEETDEKPLLTGGVTIDLLRRTVTRDGVDVHLTPKEYAVLAELAKHPGRVLSHAHLLRSAWGPAQEKQTDYLRVAIRALRQKLERDPAHPRIILNEPAVGYRLVAG